MIETKLNVNGREVKYIWRPLKSLKGIEPIWQVYGVCFTKDDKICVIRNPLDDGFTPWYLPGGTPEKDETPIETLIREVDEEADIDITNIILLGAQEVIFPNNPDKKRGDHFYQLRYYALIDKIKEQTLDPHDNKMVDRRFINISEFFDYIKWGEIGKALFEASLNEYKR